MFDTPWDPPTDQWPSGVGDVGGNHCVHEDVRLYRSMPYPQQGICRTCGRRVRLAWVTA